MVVQQFTQQDSDTKKTEKELYAEIDRLKKRRGSCFNCRNFFLGLLLLALIAGLGMVSLVAATGALEIPIISSIVYSQAPQPKRVVTAAGEIKIGEPKIIDPQQGLVAIAIGEDVLTKLLQTPNQDGTLLLKKGQIAIDEDSVEIYGSTTIKPISEPLILRIELQEIDNDVKLAGIKVGYVPIPIDLARPVLSTLLKIDSFSLKDILTELLFVHGNGGNGDQILAAISLEKGQVIFVVQSSDPARTLKELLKLF